MMAGEQEASWQRPSLDSRRREREHAAGCTSYKMHSQLSRTALSGAAAASPVQLLSMCAARVTGVVLENLRCPEF